MLYQRSLIALSSTYKNRINEKRLLSIQTLGEAIPELNPDGAVTVLNK